MYTKVYKTIFTKIMIKEKQTSKIILIGFEIQSFIFLLEKLFCVAMKVDDLFQYAISVTKRWHFVVKLSIRHQLYKAKQQQNPYK